MPILILRAPASGGGGSSFDFYIGPSGSNVNPGTVGSPWAITALNDSTLRNTYKGKRVGFLDGTYNLYTLIQAGVDDGFVPALNVQGGTSGFPTVLGAVNPGQVIFECRNGGVTYPTINTPVVGNTLMSQQGYLEIYNLIIQGFGSKGIYLGGGAAVGTGTRYQGYKVDSCELRFQNAGGFASGNNFSCIEAYATNGLQLINNYCHSNSANLSSKNGDHYSSTLQWFGQNSLLEYNSCIDSGGLYGKEHGNFGSILRYNYVDCTGWTNTIGIQDWGDDDNTSDGVATLIHHNVLVNTGKGIDLRASLGASPFADSLKVYSNTVLVNSSGQSLGICGHVNAGLLEHYNNIIYSSASGGSDLDMICFNTSADGIIDYDLFYSSVSNYVYGSFSAPNSDTRNGTTTFSTWQSTMGGTPESNSVRGSDPLFTSTGSNANKYKLQSIAGGFGADSPAINAGKSNGTSGGTSVDMGAWGNSPPARIGSNLS